MAIDTAAKRRGAIATRRLPWFRRFALPLPDGTVGQADRQQMAFVYPGIAVLALATPPIITATLEFTFTHGGTLNYVHSRTATVGM